MFLNLNFMKHRCCFLIGLCRTLHSEITTPFDKRLEINNIFENQGYKYKYSFKKQKNVPDFNITKLAPENKKTVQRNQLFVFCSSKNLNNRTRIFQKAKYHWDVVPLWP